MMPCDKNAKCTNSDGSFSCVCNPGYIGNGKTCAQLGKPIMLPINTVKVCDTFVCCFTDDHSCSDICDQRCIRSSEPFFRICACDHGYYLDADKHTCRGIPLHSYLADSLLIMLLILVPIHPNIISGAYEPPEGWQRSVRLLP